MKRISPFIALIICLFFACMAQANVVELDFAAKSASSDSDTIDPKGVRVDGDQIGVFIPSNIKEAQSFTLKVNGLKDQDYDVYINGSYASKFAYNDLVSGLEIDMPATVAHPDYMRCLVSLRPIVEKEQARFEKIKGEEPVRILNTLRQASEWVRSAITQDETYRSVSVIIAPAGKIIKPMKWRTWTSAEDTARAITRSCWLLQKARDRMYKAIKDPVYRNDAVLAMTPVFFDVDYKVVKGKGTVTAKVTNDTNLPLNGNLSLALPKGWKTSAKSLAFKDVEPGKVWSSSFDLTPPTKNMPAPEKLDLAVNGALKYDVFYAEFKIKKTAAAGD